MRAINAAAKVLSRRSTVGSRDGVAGAPEPSVSAAPSSGAGAEASTGRALDAPLPPPMKLLVRMVVSKGLVCGVLTVTPTWIVFEPNLSDPLTVEMGSLRLQFSADMTDVAEVEVLGDGTLDSGAGTFRPPPPRHPMFAPEVALAEFRMTIRSGDAALIKKTFHGVKSELCVLDLYMSGFLREVELRREAELAQRKQREQQLLMQKQLNASLEEAHRAALQEQKVRGGSRDREPGEEGGDRASAGAGAAASLAASSSSGPRKAPIVIGAAYPPLMTSHTVAVPHLSKGSGSAQGGSGRGEHPTSGPPSPIPVLVEVTLMGESRVASLAELSQIAGALPMRFQERKWLRLYSSLTDGVSLQTLMRKAGEAPGSNTVLLIRTTANVLLGGFATERWQVQPKYFGNGECLIFSFAPTFHSQNASGMNSFYQFADDKYIALGGGGKYGLEVDGDLARGTSGACPTFASAPLLPDTEDFDVLHVELWLLQ